MSSRIVAAGLAFAVLTAFAACSDPGSDASSSSGTSDTPAGADSTMGADGSAGPVGDAAGATPDTATPDGSADAAAAAPGCQGPEDCAADEVCDCHAQCSPQGTTACVEDKNCGATATNYCDLCSGYCGIRKDVCEPCQKDYECKQQGSACLDLAAGGRFCGRACIADVGCPKGFLCQAVPNVKEKQCVPQSGSCEQPGECGEDVDCAYPLICNQDLLVCAGGCPDDDACPNDLVCTGGHCVPPCDAATAPCKAGEECKDGHCKVPGGCVDASECPLAETYCDLGTHTCKPGCLTDFDCKQSAKECKDGACVEKGCPGNFYCAFEQVCSKDSGKCEDAVGPYCDACDQDAEDQCGGGNNLCIGFQDEDGNELGDFCLIECGPDADNPCPQGYACEELEVQEGDKRKLCVRNCPVPPVGGTP